MAAAGSNHHKRSGLKAGVKGAGPLSKRSKSDTSSTSSSETEPKIEPGIIKKIELTDFMCHGRLVHEFGPNVNIITGKNGSGKSSIFQAFIIGLGGSAKTTDRGFKQLGRFVRQGAKRSVIKIWMNNTSVFMSDTYKPEKFGDCIIFERVVEAAGGSRMTLKNSTGKVVFKGEEANSERKKILNKFGISLDNPTMILQQEKAKTFFTSNDAHTLYKFIADGTGISQSLTAYSDAKQTQTELKDKAEAIIKDLEKKNNKRKVAQRKREEQMQNWRGAQERFKDNVDQLLWAFVLAAKKKGETCNAELEDLKSQQAEAERTKEECEAKAIPLKTKIQRLEAKDAEHKKLQDKHDDKMRKLKAAVKKFEADYNKAGKEHDSARLLLQQATSEIKLLDNRIREGKMKKAEVAKAKGESEKAVAVLERTFNQRREELENAEDRVQEVRNEGKAFASKKSSLFGKKTALKKERQSLEHKKQDLGNPRQRSRHSEQMLNLLRDIDGNRHRFREGSPIGPLADHIKVKHAAGNGDALVSELVEVFLGRSTLETFIVLCKQDRDLLSKLAKDAFPHQKPPTICLVPPQTRSPRFAVRSQSLPHFRFVIDILLIDNDAVFNYLVDRKSIEQVLVGEDRRIQEQFSGSGLPSSVNVKIGLGYDFNKYVPKTANQNYGQYYLNKLGANRSLLQRDNQQEINRCQIEINECLQKLRSCERDLGAMTTEEVRLNRCLAEAKKEVKLKSDHMEKMNRDLKKARAEKVRLEDGSVEALERRKAEVEQEKAKAIKEEKAKSDIFAKKKAEFKKANEDDAAAEEDEIEFQRKVSLTDDKLKKLRGELRDLKLAEKEHAVAKVKNQVMNKERLLLEFKAKEDFNREKAIKNSNIPEPKEEDILQGEQLKKVYMEQKGLVKFKDQEGIEVKIPGDDDDIQAQLTRLQTFQKENLRLDKSLLQRNNHACKVYYETSRAIRSTFARTMSEVNLISSYKMRREEETVTVMTNNLSMDKLSGGERSKTMVCLISALWDAMFVPFLCLDEWDVGLDDDARPDVERLLIETGTQKRGNQIFLINPTKSDTRNISKWLRDLINRGLVTIIEIQKT